MLLLLLLLFVICRRRRRRRRIVVRRWPAETRRQPRVDDPRKKNNFDSASVCVSRLDRVVFIITTAAKKIEGGPRGQTNTGFLTRVLPLTSSVVL